MANREVHFDAEPYESLDRLALLMRQDYNRGGEGDWLGAFREGLYGFYARLYGVRHHYSEVHAWLPRFRTPTETEYHLASILFQMDSALECLTFALNALGWIAMPSGFRDVTDMVALRQVGPHDILGSPMRNPSVAGLPGYAAVFGSLHTLWSNQEPLIGQIRDLHDVSKHRRAIYTGGWKRLDAPDGFYESLGFLKESRNREDGVFRTLSSPEAKIRLQPDPRAPLGQRETPSVARTRFGLLEDLAPSFVSFIDSSGAAALADAQKNIRLKEVRFLNGSTPQVRKMND